MQFNPKVRGLCLGMLCLSALAQAEEMRAPASAADLEFFESRVRPVLSQNCYGCHGPEKQKGGLRLDHIKSILAGGDSGPALVAGKPAESRIHAAISYANVDLQMPPDGILSEADRNTLTEWITRGAPWPDEPVPSGGPKVTPFDLEKRRDEHWAWKAITDPTPPAVHDERFQHHPVDQFLQAKREEKGLATAPEADRRVLARRASFALTGLPPTPAEVDAFLNDSDPDAYGHLLDRLLASPAFGERWSRHWFDLVRFAETHGHEGDYPIRYSWPYRDYVIRALNADVPYDQFVREHIAGDLLPEPRRNPQEGYNESVIATGFWYMHQATHAPVDVKRDQADRIDNQLDVMSKTFLGLTVSCTRCHDHKFDAIPSKDYYAMAGYLYSSRQSVAFLDPGDRIRSSAEAQKATLQEEVTRTMKAIEATPSIEHVAVAPYLAAAAKVRYNRPTPTDGVPLELPADNQHPAPRPAVGRPVAKVAEESGLDAGLLESWVTALSEPGADKPGHPLYLWNLLSRESRELNTRQFLENAHAIMDETPHVAVEDPGSRTYATFDHGDFEGWFCTGDAFGAAPTGSGTWQAIDGTLVPALAGTANSGLVSGRLQGTLRSPDFTIDCDYIHVRVAGQNTRVRLVIDGYQLRTDNGLLFDDTLIDLGDTRGAFAWRTMGKQVGKYRGQTAYIELIDESPGYIAVDQIVFSNQAEPPAESALPVAGLLPDDSDVKTQFLDEVAQRYEVAFRDAWQSSNVDERATNPFNALLIRRGLWWSPETMSTRDATRAALAESEGRIGEPFKVIAMTSGTSDDAEFFIRGDHRNTSGTVSKAFLSALDSTLDSRAPDRLALANKIVDPRNPLTARVYVNRVWHHLFGRGIVASVDNFGKLGQLPTHPELLDFLATRFMEHGWSTKWLIKYLMETETFRMSSVPSSPEAEERDPANLLLHRMGVKRLEGEAIRDTLLALAGDLDGTMYGPSVPAYIPAFELDRRSPASGPLDGNHRRTIYLEVRRNHLLPMATAFDMPVPDTTIGARTVSNLPAQALIMMNDPFVISQAEVWCDRALASQPADFNSLADQLYLAALTRLPHDDERQALLSFVQSQAALYGIAQGEVWRDKRVLTDLCHTIFMLKEFIYIG